MMHVVYQYKEECEHLRQQLAKMTDYADKRNTQALDLEKQLAENVAPVGVFKLNTETGYWLQLTKSSPRFEDDGAVELFTHPSPTDTEVAELKRQLAEKNAELKLAWETNTEAILRQQLAECERERDEYGRLNGLEFDARCRAEVDLSALQAKYDELVKLSVTNIMIGIAPGDDGMGEEVYAKSVADVERELNKLCQKLDVVEQQRDELLVIVECAAVEPCISDDECYVCLSCQAREVLAKVGADKTDEPNAKSQATAALSSVACTDRLSLVPGKD